MARPSAALAMSRSPPDASDSTKRWNVVAPGQSALPAITAPQELGQPNSLLVERELHQSEASLYETQRLSKPKVVHSVAWSDLAARFIEEPHAPLGLVDPHLDEARCRHIVFLVAELVGLPQGTD
jgi:hypothetical protein